MKLNRRGFLAAAGAVPLSANLAWAASFPAKPIRIVVPFDVGGTVDPVIRLLAEAITKASGAALVVENKGGAGGTIGATAVAQEQPDGYALLGCTNAMSVAQAMFKSLPWSVVNDFTFIGTVGAVPLAILANTERVSAGSVEELVAFARANPGLVTYGSAGVGSTAHLAGELFQQHTGTELTHVAFKGAGPASAGLMSGTVDLLFSGYTASGPILESGRGKLIAVTGKTRAPQAPDVPAVAEAYPGYAISTWVGLAGPKGLPDDIRATIAGWIETALADAAFRDRLVAMGVSPDFTAGPDVAAMAAREVAEYSQIIDSVGIGRL